MLYPPTGEAILELISPDNSRHRVPLTKSPFFVGRGEEGNHLSIPDKRISRQCAAVVRDQDRYSLDDRGHRLGVFINGDKISSQVLKNGDVITFGLEDSFRLIFHSAGASALPKPAAGMASVLSTMISGDDMDSFAGELNKLDLLLEATKLLHSQRPLEAVLEEMLDRAISITHADRGLLLEADEAGTLRQWLARRSGAGSFPAQEFSPSQTAVGLAIERKSAVITGDLRQGEDALNAAQSVMIQRLRSVVAIPLYSMPRANTEASITNAALGEFLGVLYLDSRRSSAFSQLDRQILDAIAIQSASILHNARMVKREIERQRMDQELSIACSIQQALLPRGLHDFPHLSVRGVNFPCLEVGGDYFDVFPIDGRRTAFLIADVSGKGLGAALVTTILQGALSGMAIGAEPARVFEHLNNFLCGHTEVGRYATLFFGTVDPEGNLEYLNAGHLPPLVMRRGEVAELFREGSFPVGLIPEAKYSVARAKLEPGDTLVLFSDGVTEAANKAEEMFGGARLQKLLAGQHDAPLDGLQKTVVDAVETFAGGASQADDITLLLVRYRTPAGSASTTAIPGGAAMLT